MKYTSNKNIRDIIYKSFKEIKSYAPKEVVTAATLKNLDEFEKYLRERQKKSEHDIHSEFDELIFIAYAAAISFGVFSFSLNDENTDKVFTKSWIEKNGIENQFPNKILESLFATISNNILAVLKLIESGLELPARSMLRITLEHFWLSLVLISDKDMMINYHQGQEPKDARDTWYKHFKPIKVMKALKRLEERLYPEMHTMMHDLREDQYSFYTQSVHTTAVFNLLGTFGTSIDDHNRLEPSLFGYPSATSVIVLRDLCLAAIYTYSIFFKIIEEVHELSVPTTGMYFPFVHAMRNPLSNLLTTVFKYNNYLKIDEGADGTDLKE